MTEPHHDADDEKNQTTGHEELFAVMTGHAVFTTHSFESTNGSLKTAIDA